VTTIGGLPAHILLVHAVVVLVPLAALLVVLVTAWPAARARLITVHEIGDSGSRAAWTGQFADASQAGALGVAERPG
jgi:hypothetical protein